MTFIPFSASFLAVSNPMPLFAPDIKATFSVINSFKSLIFHSIINYKY